MPKCDNEHAVLFQFYFNKEPCNVQIFNLTINHSVVQYSQPLFPVFNDDNMM